MFGRIHIAGLLAAAALFATPLSGVADVERKTEAAGPYAITVFGGQLADNTWKELVTFNDVSMRDSYLAAVALSRELAAGDNWSFEVEGQTVKHFGAQDHWEFNGVLIGRWRGFPWRATLPTSVAFGIGPSYATEVPSEEVAMDGESARLLLYWTAELEFGLPERPWSAVAKLHHRSNAYGLFAETGGSNWITFGLRRRF